ncbi:MAG: restriction endonuclease subunit S, partial [Candidatus Dadabacteria bacterium]|nr:restriction endonuclease subunit S [Candidatus Dadabacteria bacterium]
MKEVIDKKTPTGWNVVKLGNELELLYGKSLKKDSREGGHYPVYGSNGIVGFHNQKAVTGPGIIVGRKGSIGKVHYSKKDFYPIDTTYYVSLKNPHNTLFIFYLLTYLKLDTMNAHSTIPGLNRKQVYSIETYFPPLSQQKRIAKTLSTIQEAIETQDKIIGNLRELKKVVMEKVFTKGLDGEKTKQTEIGEMPEGWELKTIDQIADIHNTLRQPINSVERSNIKGVYPYCGANGIVDHINDYRFDGEYVLIAEDGGYWG